MDYLPIFEATFAALRDQPRGRHRRPDAPRPTAPIEEIKVPDPQSVSRSATPLEDLRITEPTSPLLRRHVVHDPRSRNHPLTDRGLPTRRIIWPRVGPVFDQNLYNGGQGLGCCTACAGYGLLMTAPFSTGRVFSDRDVQDLYHLETTLDDSEIPGTWPPEDTGSAGLYLMKALKQQGLITGYRHAFSVRAALSALADGPVAVGTTWLESMNDPYRGVLSVDPRSTVEGGHEYDLRGYDPRGHGWVLMQNSWGTKWGVDLDGPGSAWIDLPSFAWLLSQQGDVVQPTVRR